MSAPLPAAPAPVEDLLPAGAGIAPPPESETDLTYPALIPPRLRQHFILGAFSLFGVPMHLRDITQEDKKHRHHSKFVWIDRFGQERRERLYKGVAKNGQVRPLPKLGAYWFPKEEVDLGDDGLIGLNFHGGAYAIGSAQEEDGTARIPKTLIKRGILKRVLSVEYRLTNRSPFPGQLIDGITAYAYLVEDLKIPPSRIVVIGDSAGGHLALTLGRYLVDEKVLDLPKGFLLLSPWCDMKEDGSRLAKQSSSVIKSFLGKSDPSLLASSPYFSPASCSSPRGDFPPLWPNTFISLGGTEFLYDQVNRLYNRMRHGKEFGVGVDDEKVELFIGKNCGHDYLCADDSFFRHWNKEEREETWRRIGEWVRRLRADS